jgi:hypothetical protein
MLSRGRSSVGWLGAALLGGALLAAVLGLAGCTCNNGGRPARIGDPWRKAEPTGQRWIGSGGAGVPSGSPPAPGDQSTGERPTGGLGPG